MPTGCLKAPKFTEGEAQLLDRQHFMLACISLSNVLSAALSLLKQMTDQRAQPHAVEQYGAIVCALHVVSRCTIYGCFALYQNVKCHGKRGIVKFTAILGSDHSTVKLLKERTSISQFYSVLFNLKTDKKRLIWSKLNWFNRIKLRIRNGTCIINRRKCFEHFTG